jgi:hypothetical protein
METVNLFEDYKNIPKEVNAIIKKYNYFEDATYKDLEECLKELETIGYTFDYYLDAQPYDLRKINP